MPARARQAAEEVARLADPSVSQGLELTVFAPPGLVANPLTLDLDDEGRAYVVASSRAGLLLDIRQHSDCRKVALSEEGDSIEVWGDGKQTRSFLYIDECIEATRRLMDSDFSGPVNIGSEEMISINDFARLAIEISGKPISIRNIYGDEFKQQYGFPCPVGVRGRNSDNALIRSKLDWDYSMTLRSGMKKTYSWISSQAEKRRGADVELNATGRRRRPTPKIISGSGQPA